MVDRYCPSEDVEESNFASWCDEMGYVHWHIPNDVWIQGWKQKAHNTSLGVRKGASDHWVKIPTPLHPNGSLLVIEFKRQFGNTPTDEQIKFIHDMNEIDNVAATCCYGAEEAKQVVIELIDGDFTTFDKCQERVYKIEENRKKRQKNAKKSQKNENALPY